MAGLQVSEGQFPIGAPSVDVSTLSGLALTASGSFDRSKNQILVYFPKLVISART